MLLTFFIITWLIVWAIGSIITLSPVLGFAIAGGYGMVFSWFV